MKLSHASHSPWKSPSNGDSTHFHRTDCYWVYTDIYIFAAQVATARLQNAAITGDIHLSRCR
jgi:hypothetical protein